MKLANQRISQTRRKSSDRESLTFDCRQPARDSRQGFRTMFWTSLRTGYRPLNERLAKQIWSLSAAVDSLQKQRTEHSHSFVFRIQYLYCRFIYFLLLALFLRSISNKFRSASNLFNNMTLSLMEVSVFINPDYSAGSVSSFNRRGSALDRRSTAADSEQAAVGRFATRRSSTRRASPRRCSRSRGSASDSHQGLLLHFSGFHRFISSISVVIFQTEISHYFSGLFRILIIVLLEKRSGLNFQN